MCTCIVVSSIVKIKLLEAIVGCCKKRNIYVEYTSKDILYQK
jgi:hypothetical protein